MKIGIFGGSFDPVHDAHVNLCNTMLYEFELDKIIVVPTYISPFKNTASASCEHRLAMCIKAFEDNPKIEVSDIEILRGTKSYSIDTIHTIKEMYPDAQLYFIMGGDSFMSLSRWYRAEEIFSLVHVLSVIREDDDIKALSQKGTEYEAFGAKYTFVNKSMGDISSTKIRDILKSGSADKLPLPEKVVKYILENDLYE